MNLVDVKIADVVSMLTAVGVITGLVIQFRKYNSDAYSSMLAALKTSGQTIGDLMTMIADMPVLRQQLSEALSKIDAMAIEEKAWRSERNEWKLGIARLIAQLVRARITPEWLPRGVELQQFPDPEGGPTTIKVIGEIP